MTTMSATAGATTHPEPTYMGWYDPRKSATPETIIAGAVQRFERKYARLPATIVAHPATEIAPEVAPDVQIITSAYVPIGYLYVGPIEE